MDAVETRLRHLISLLRTSDEDEIAYDALVFIRDNLDLDPLAARGQMKHTFGMWSLPTPETVDTLISELDREDPIDSADRVSAIILSIAPNASRSDIAEASRQIREVLAATTLRDFAEQIAPGEELGLSEGEGSVQLAVAAVATHVIEDVIGDCGDNSTSVLASNIGTTLGARLARIFRRE